MKHIISAFKDWKIWAAIIMFWANTIGVYGFTATVPTVIADLGYSSANAQLLTVPVYFTAMLVTLSFAFISDKYKQRTPFIMAGYTISTLGLIAQLAIPKPRLPGLTYGMLFVVASGLYAPFTSIVSLIGILPPMPPSSVTILTYISTGNNLAPSSKRAVGMALMISVGNWGGIAGSNIYLSRQAPKYPVGFGVSLAMSVAAIGVAYILRVTYRRINEERDRMLAEEGEEAIRARYTEQELLDLGDLNPFFRYTV